MQIPLYLEDQNAVSLVGVSVIASDWVMFVGVSQSGSTVIKRMGHNFK